MVKKLKYLLFIIPFLFIPNVNAQILGTPLSSVDYVDGTNDQANAELANWWDTEYYQAPFRIGYFTSATAEANKIAFLWSNANLCSGQNLKISGQIGGLFNFFRDNSYSFNFINHSKNMTCSFEYQSESRVGFTCVGEGGGNLYIAVNQLSFSSRENYSIGIRRDFGISCDATNLQILQQDIINTQNIINNQNSNTQNIISNNNQTSQNIINNQNQNTQDIIDNQNANTEKEIESQKVCTNININSSDVISTPNYALGDSNNEVYDTSLAITDYISLEPNIDYTLSGLRGYVNSYCLYNSDKSNFTCQRYNGSSTLTFNSSSYSFIRFTASKNSSSYLTGNFCKNGNQALTDSITSENAPNTSTELNNLDSSTASDTPISDLITLPITLANVFINGIETSCSPVNLGNLYGTDLTLPCINLEQRLGSNLWSTIDILFSIFMCYNIGMLFITAFSGITSLRDDFDSLYQPKHADTGYQPKHGG